MRGGLLVPSSSPTLSPIYDGLDVKLTSKSRGFTSTMTRFHVKSIHYPSAEGTPLHMAVFFFFPIAGCYFGRGRKPATWLNFFSPDKNKLRVANVPRHDKKYAKTFANYRKSNSPQCIIIPSQLTPSRQLTVGTVSQFAALPTVVWSPRF